MSALKIGIVGPCASGKSSLAAALAQRGLTAKQIVQEHSYAPQMWQIIGQPGFLIYLDASFESCTQRKALDWTAAEYEQQLQRLAHAREHCDFYLSTDGLSKSQVADRTVDELRHRGLLTPDAGP